MIFLEVCEVCDGEGYDDEAECPVCLGRSVVPTLEAIDKIDELLDEVRHLRTEAATDGPVYERGRWEGRADVAARLREILDPEDKNKWTLDGCLKEVKRLVAKSSINLNVPASKWSYCPYCGVKVPRAGFHTNDCPASNLGGEDGFARGIKHIVDNPIDLDMMYNRVEVALPKVEDPIIADSTEKKKSGFSFLWFQCSQCGWGERMSKAEAQADGWEGGSACPHCGIGPIRSSPMGRFR